MVRASVAPDRVSGAARRRPMLRPLLGWLTLVAFAVGRIVGLAHFAVEGHRRCALHGELIELDAPPAPDESSPSAPATVFAAQRAGGADHAHCPFSGALHPQDTASVFDTVERVDTLALVPRHAPFVDSISTRAVYRVAPKTSPPTALLSIA